MARTHIITGAAVTLILLIAGGAKAQGVSTSASSFSDLNNVLKTGQRIVVTDENGRETQGTIVDLATSSLTVLTVEKESWTGGRVPSQQLRFSEENVSKIRHHDSVATGMWIGLGAGGATYMAIMSALGCGNDSECSLIANASALPFIPAGALVGALIDRLIGPGNRTVYAARPQGSLTSVAVAPWLGKDGGGLSVKLRF